MKIRKSSRKSSSKKSLILLPTLSFSLTRPSGKAPQPIILDDITSNNEEQTLLFEILKQVPRQQFGAFAKAINTLSTKMTSHLPAINKNTLPT